MRSNGPPVRPDLAGPPDFRSNRIAYCVWPWIILLVSAHPELCASAANARWGKRAISDVVMLCSYIPGGGSALRQLRAAGVDLPVLTGDAMDGNYWLASVPNLKDFYLAVQAPAAHDPRPELNAVTDAYKAKYGNPPATGFAYPIYAFLQLWAKAVAKAGTTDGKAVVAVLETFHNEPTILGPRSFSSTLHIQDQIPMLIEEVRDGEDRVVDEVPSSDAIPPAVLFRQKN
jgi:branched-chain amino acid transport system substrate-binding protein